MARHGRWRRFVVRPLVWSLAVLALGLLALRLLLSTEFVRERVRVLIETRAGEAIGRAVQIGDLEFELLPLAIVARDLVVPGDRPDGPAFATLRRLEIGGNLASLRRSVLDLSTVRVEGLDIRLELRPDGDNLPRLVSKRGGERRIEVEIGYLAVVDSTVRLDERRVDLALEARGVEAAMTGVGGTDLEGELGADAVEVRLPGAQPVTLAVAGRARLLADRLELFDVRAEAPDFLARASGQVRWRETRRIDLTGTVDADARFVEQLGYLQDGLAGRVHAAGTLGWTTEQWGWRATVSSPQFELFGFRLDQLSGVAAGDASRIRFDLAEGRFEGGEVEGLLEVGLGGDDFPAHLGVELAGGDLDRLLARFSVPVAGLAGAVDGRLDYEFPLRDARSGSGTGDFVVRPRSGGVPATGGGQIALSGGRLTLSELELVAGAQQVDGSVAVDLDGGLGRVDLRVRSEDLGELASLPTLFDPGQLWRPTTGVGELLLGIDLAPRGPHVEAELLLADVHAPGAVADGVRGTLVAGPTALERIELLLARGAARLAIAGRLPFGERDDSLALELVAEEWPAEDAAPWLPFALPLSGPLHGQLTLAGSLAALSGEVTATVGPATVGGLTFERLAAQVAFDPEQVAVERLRAVAEAGALTGSGTYGVEGGALDFQFATADRGLDLTRAPFDPLGAAGLAGTLVAAGRVEGTLERPQFAVQGGLVGLTLAGSPLADGEAPFDLRLADGELRADVDLGALGRLSGGGSWRPDAATRLEFQLASERLDRWAALAAPEQFQDALAGPDGIQGALAADLALELAPATAPRATLRIPQLEFRQAGRTIQSLEPIVVLYEAGEIRIVSAYLGSDPVAPDGADPAPAASGDELFVAGRIVLGEPGVLALNVQASLAASWAAPLLGDLELGGRIDALGRIGGTLARPEINGQAEWADGRLLPPGIPHSIERVRALALFYPDAVVVDRAHATFAGGELTGSGRLDLPAAGATAAPEYRFEVAARHVAPRWPAGWQLRGDADLVLASSPEGRQLRGDLRFDRLWYLQDIRLTPAQLVQRLLTRTRLEVTSTDELLSTTGLALVVRGPGAVRVRNNLARLAGSADLAVRGTLARPVLFGEITLEPGGSVEYGGNRFVIERGEIAFLNPSRIEPLLDVVTRARIDQYDVTFGVSGSLERLNTTFASDPPLPDLDILGLIATGAPVGRAAFSEVAPATDPTASGGAAEALLYGQAASLLTARVGELFGFDRLQVKPLTSGDTVSAASVTIGKRLSSRLYVTYSLDPSSTAQQILQAEWRITDRLMLVLTQNGNESYSVDARWESRF